MLGFDPFCVLQLMSPPLILGKADSGRLYVGVGKAVLMIDQQATEYTDLCFTDEMMETARDRGCLTHPLPSTLVSAL